MAHFVYIIYSSNRNKFYIGETVNVLERINQHNSGFYKSSFSKQANDWELYLKIECDSRNQALRLEKFIKKMRNRQFYDRLKENPEMQKELLERFKG